MCIEFAESPYREAPVIFSNPILPPEPPKLGEHSKLILEKLGYDSETIKLLVKQKIIQTA